MGLKDMPFHLPSEGRPKVFVMVGAILAPQGYRKDMDTVVSLQISPDYTGSPFHPDQASRPQGLLYRSLRSWEDNVELRVGGGLQESFAYGGSAPSRAITDPASENGTVLVS